MSHNISYLPSLNPSHWSNQWNLGHYRVCFWFSLWKISFCEKVRLEQQKQLFADVFQNRCSKKFRNIHRKTPSMESLEGLQLYQRLQHRCFPENIAKFIRAAFSIEHFLWLLLQQKIVWKCLPKLCTIWKSKYLPGLQRLGVRS